MSFISGFILDPLSFFFYSPFKHAALGRGGATEPTLKQCLQLQIHKNMCNVREKNKHI